MKLEKNSKIYVVGHRGMVGSAVLALLKCKGYKNLIYKSSQELDLRDQKKVEIFFKRNKPEYVFFFAARVGGIKANIDSPAEFLYDNIMMESNIIHASYKYNVKKLLYLGSSCVYPRLSPQPIKEDYLLDGKLEPTNEGYALAKIVGLKLCEYYNRQYDTNFISLVSPNLYGLGDNFDPAKSHVIAALIRKFTEAKKKGLASVKVWGTGKAKREFLYMQDVARACLYFMNSYDAGDLPPFVNIGHGTDLTIRELANIIADKSGYEGEICWDKESPEGMPRKVLDVSESRKLCWEPETGLAEGISQVVAWFKEKYLD